MSALAANARVVGALGMRSIRQTFRRPQLIAPIVARLARQAGTAATVAASISRPSAGGAGRGR